MTRTILILALLLAGCGGGGTEHDADTMPVVCQENPEACT